jgi:hypothetical protein
VTGICILQSLETEKTRVTFKKRCGGKEKALSI